MRHLKPWLVLALVAPMVLAACGDAEMAQRKAFVAFLQTRILDKPGIHVPQLTPDETKAFGPYGAQYAVITDFHKVMNESVSPRLTASLSQGTIRSVGELISRQSTIQAARTTMQQMAAALGDDLAHADAAHVALNQPPEVKAAFDSAYERLVTVPATTFRAIAPVAEKAFTDALDLANYIDEHKKQIVVSGATLQASAAVREAVNAKLQALTASTQAVQRAQATMQAMVYGAKE